jgi:hypothetical protein
MDLFCGAIVSCLCIESPSYHAAVKTQNQRKTVVVHKDPVVFKLCIGSRVRAVTPKLCLVPGNQHDKKNNIVVL